MERWNFERFTIGGDEKNGEAGPSAMKKAEGRQCLNTYHDKAAHGLTSRTPLRQQRDGKGNQQNSRAEIPHRSRRITWLLYVAQILHRFMCPGPRVKVKNAGCEMLRPWVDKCQKDATRIGWRERPDIDASSPDQPFHGLVQ